LINYYEKWSKEAKKERHIIRIEKEDFDDLKSYKDLKKIWEIKGGN